MAKKQSWITETKAGNGGGREAGHLGSLRGLTGTGTITEAANETGEGTGTIGVTVSHVTETGVTEDETTVKRDGGETEVAAGPGAPEVTSTRRASETEAKRKTSRRSKSSVKSKKSLQIRCVSVR